jgi:hypothetical protein
MSKAPSSTENLFAGIAGIAAAPAPATPAAPVAPVVPAIVDEDDAPAPQISELEMLKNRARLMGIVFSNNIGVDALRAKVRAKMEGEAEPVEAAPAKVEAETTTEVAAAPTTAPATPAAKKLTLRQSLRQSEMALVRLRITNLDPKKKDLPGEIFTFANRILGSVKKYVPYGEATENGYHVPVCIYKQLKAREFLQIKTTKNSKGQDQVNAKYVREFALEVLPMLTTKELASLAASQAAAGGLD